MPICSFCGKSYEWPRGLSQVNSVDGRITYLCSSKCRKNLNLKRDKKKVMWIRKAGWHQEAEKARIKKAV